MKQNVDKVVVVFKRAPIRKALMNYSSWKDSEHFLSKQWRLATQEETTQYLTKLYGAPVELKTDEKENKKERKVRIEEPRIEREEEKENVKNNS